MKFDIGKAFDNAKEGIMSAATTVADGAVEAAGKVKEGAINVAGDVADFAADAVDEIKGITVSAAETVKDGVANTAYAAQEATEEFHDKYVSKVLPDCGKYGDVAKFAAEMVPGVAEYNALKDGDWTGFAVAAGCDIAALAAGAVTLGAGYAAVKGGGVVAKAGVKVATKEIAEAGAKKVIKEVAEVGVKKVAKETVEAGTEKIVKETAETVAEKAVKETIEVSAEKVVKETAETGAEKATKELMEESGEKTLKEVSEKVADQETFDKISQIEQNKRDGIARELLVQDDLVAKYGDGNVIREALLRNADGVPIKDVITQEARRIDFVVKNGDKIIKSVEVTSETAPKAAQIAKEMRILNMAKETGGAFIKDPNTGKLIEFTQDIVTEIRRLK